MATLLIADHDNTALSPQTARALTAALAIGEVVDIMVAGKDASAVADAAAMLAGVRKVLLVQSDALEHQLAEPLAGAILSVAGDYDTFVGSTTSVAKDTMPRVAAALDVMQISDAVAVLGRDTFRRPIYAGNAIQTVRSLDEKRVVTVRTSAFAPAGTAAPSPIEATAISLSPGSVRFVEQTVSTSDRPELADARVVVSGGRALGSQGKFNEILIPLADALGAALGASRAAVDAGYAPNDWQVGQTGKIVAPDLYLAIGISGAIQHVAGMKDAKVIVAINSDAEAPIFQVADYGLVGDLFVILPELRAALAA